MKTPEEIKYTLYWCRNSDANNQCLGCPYKKIEDCEYALDVDAFDYIRQLENQIADLSKIREAHAADVVQVVRCKDCCMHGKCCVEEAFNFCRMPEAFCCVGKRVSDDEHL